MTRILFYIFSCCSDNRDLKNNGQCFGTRFTHAAVNGSVVQAVPEENYTVYAYFSDGSVRLADIKPLISRGGVLLPLQDEKVFRDALTVMNYAVAWDLAGN